MPEAPEVRRYADELAAALDGKVIVAIAARTKKAKQWLSEYATVLQGRKIERIFALGKNIIGLIEGGYYFYSHQMMWGRWNVHLSREVIPSDRRERARISVDGATAILMSAPIFEIGVGDPLNDCPFLKELGPYVLPYEGAFDEQEFLKRLGAAEQSERTLGDALLDQKILSGLGNYLRAEVMFLARLNPWRQVKTLKSNELKLLCQLVASVSGQAYATGGFTVTPELKKRMAGDHSLVYVPGKEYGTRHYVFRRTNLPCLVCGTPVRQARQVTTGRADDVEEADEKSRIVYFCPDCQKVDVSALPAVRAVSRQKTSSQPKSAMTDAKLSKTISGLLAQRAAGRSICPSEVARFLQPEDWRELMPRIRQVADKMRAQKKIIVTQKDKTIKSAQAAVGPIRFRLCEPGAKALKAPKVRIDGTRRK